MSDIRQQARELNEKAVDLISQVMEKHTKAMLEQIQADMSGLWKENENLKASLKLIECYVEACKENDMPIAYERIKNQID